MFFGSILEGGYNATGYVSDSEIAEIIENAPIIECYDEPVGAVMRFVYESEVNYNAICNAINMQQLAYMNENAGQMMVLEAGEIKSVIDKFITWLNDMIGKIKGQVSKVVEWIDRQCDYNKQWIKSKEDKINKAAGAKINIRGYKFSNLTKADSETIYKKLSIDTNQPGVLGTVLRTCGPDDVDKTKSDDLENVRKIYSSKDALNSAKNNVYSDITGRNSDAKSFSADLKKFFRSGGDEVTFTKFEASDVIAELKAGKDAKYEVKGAYEAFVKPLAKAIAGAKKFKKKLDGKADNRALLLDCANYYINVVKFLSDTGHKVYQAQVQAIMANLTQNRKLANAAISSANDNTKAMKEGFSFLDDLELI